MPTKKRRLNSNSIATALGADELLSSQRLTLYIPDRDKNGKKVRNLQRWINGGAKILALLGRGSTALPPADVVWIQTTARLTPDEVKESDIVHETTTVLYTYLEPDRFMDNLGILRDFVHRFGKEAKQRELVIEFNNRFYKIEKFD